MQFLHTYLFQGVKSLANILFTPVHVVM